ncbi:serine/threonine-protein kinase, partial [Akkermansiaceae bacterium]|nr:serine/threonine-protein kinase [Akkermansiaceae bacterium]
MQDALGVADDERESWVKEECGNDAELLHLVLSLLENEQFLTIGSSVSEFESLIEIGTKVGPYTVLEFIGEGGFAEVFLAQQSEPVERKVALKILKSGMSSREVLARFNSERQALAMMQHSGIAKIFDAGIAGNGRSWFSMEYVAGVSITDYSDLNRLGLTGRLSLFSQVCEAVQHAHQKGIIHRDLKPNNILVGLSEGEPKVKVIDFGVAKATGGSLTGQTLFTEKGVLIGTPAYMSPEQAVSTELDIDTRSDVYSLGVVLYELLSGAPPFDPKMLRDAAFGEIHRIIQEEDPVRPSTKSTSVEEAAGIAKARRLSISSLSRRLRGDLDWIALKALEKDRTRRYSSVGEFASDLQRYLLSEPVTAGPPSTFYKFRKFAKRNRVSVIAAVAVFCVLVTGIVTTSLQWVRASKAEEKVSVEKDKVLAEKERLQKMVDFQADIFTGLDSEEVGQTLERLLEEAISHRVQSRGGSEEEADEAIETFKSLSSRGIATDVAKRLLDEELLSPAVEDISDQISGDPLTAYRLLGALAQVYWDLELLEQAEETLSTVLSLVRSNLGNDHPYTHTVIGNMARLMVRVGNIEGAEVMAREAFERIRALHGNSHEEVASAAIELGNISRAKGELIQAEKIYRNAIKLFNEVPETEDSKRKRIRAQANLGELLRVKGDHEKAGKLLKNALSESQTVLGKDHPLTLRLLNDNALWFENEGDLENAKVLLIEAINTSRSQNGSRSRNTISGLTNLGRILHDQGAFEEAKPILQEAANGLVDSFREGRGSEHEALTAIGRLGTLFYDVGEYALAESYAREALNGRRAIFGNDHIDTINSVSNMGVILWEQDLNQKAEPFLIEAIEGYKRLVGVDAFDTLVTMDILADLLVEEGRFDEATKVLVESGKARPKDEGHQKKIRRKIKGIKKAQSK